MSDFAFLESPTFDRIVAQRSHREEVLRECFRHSVERIHKDNETLVDYCRCLLRAGLDAREELKEAWGLINAELLVIEMMKREHSGEA